MNLRVVRDCWSCREIVGSGNIAHKSSNDGDNGNAQDFLCVETGIRGLQWHHKSMIISLHCCFNSPERKREIGAGEATI